MDAQLAAMKAEIATASAKEALPASSAGATPDAAGTETATQSEADDDVAEAAIEDGTGAKQ